MCTQRENERFRPKTSIVSDNCICCYCEIGLLCVTKMQVICFFCSGNATVADAADDDDDVANCTNLIQMRMRMCNLHQTESQRITIVVLCHKCTNKQSGAMHFTRVMHTHYIISDCTRNRFHQRAVVRMSSTHIKCGSCVANGCRCLSIHRAFFLYCLIPSR